MSFNKELTAKRSSLPLLTAAFFKYNWNLPYAAHPQSLRQNSEKNALQSTWLMPRGNEFFESSNCCIFLSQATLLLDAPKQYYLDQLDFVL